MRKENTLHTRSARYSLIERTHLCNAQRGLRYTARQFEAKGRRHSYYWTSGLPTLYFFIVIYIFYFYFFFRVKIFFTDSDLEGKEKEKKKWENGRKKRRGVAVTYLLKQRENVLLILNAWVDSTRLFFFF